MICRRQAPLARFGLVALGLWFFSLSLVNSGLGADPVATPSLRRINDLAASRSSAAVIVTDLPLLQTAQILPVDSALRTLAPGDAAGQFRALISELEQRLKQHDSSLENLVKLNLYAASDNVAQEVLKELPDRLPATCRPVLVPVSGKMLRPDVLISLDALAVCRVTDLSRIARAESSTTHDLPEMADSVIWPPGRLVFVSGQAEPGADLATATRQTLASLNKTLATLDLPPTSVLSTKSFVSPIAAVPAIWPEFRAAFPKGKIPPATFMEWISEKPSIEIELVAWSPRSNQKPQSVGSAPVDTVEYVTPPGMTASPVFSRVAIVQGPSLVFVGGLFGKETTSPEAEVRSVLEQLKTISEQSGSDLQHLAKATYYVANNETSQQLNLQRPSYYDPRRPPAASKAPVRGVGRPDRAIVIDMIAVGKN